MYFIGGWRYRLGALVFATAGYIAIILIFGSGSLGWYQVVAAQLLGRSTVFTWTPSDDVLMNPKTLTVIATDDSGASVTHEITIDILPRNETPLPTTPAHATNDGDGNGGGGSESEPLTPRIAGASVSTFLASKVGVVTGSYSGIVADGARRVAKLAHGRAFLSQRISTARGNCTLTATVKADKGPDPNGTVKFVTRLNKKAWKILTLPKGHNDNKYRTYTIGLLRNVKPGITLGFQLLNDAYDKDYLRRTGHLTEDRDLNLIIEKTSLACV